MNPPERAGVTRLRIKSLSGFEMRQGQTAAVDEAVALLQTAGFKVTLTPIYSAGTTYLSLVLSQARDEPKLTQI